MRLQRETEGLGTGEGLGPEIQAGLGLEIRAGLGLRYRRDWDWGG